MAGSEISITCTEGYETLNSKAICQITGTWLPQPLCVTVQCVVPQIGNGYYSNSDGTIPSPNVPYQTLIIPKCNEAYIISSVLARTCQLDKTWSGYSPYCNQISCNSLPPKFQNGNYEHSGGESPYPYNYTLNPVCYIGFYLQPTNNEIHVRHCIEIDFWNGTDPSCIRIQCLLNPPNFWNGMYNGSQAPYDFGSVLKPTCEKGYYISNNVTRRVCEHPNQWSETDPVCSIVYCNTPTIINGNVDANSNQLPYNSTIEITCNSGYELTDGAYTWTCQENGIWNSQSTQCEKIICNDTSDVRHTSIYTYPKLTLGETGFVDYNDTFFFLQQGSTQVNCSHNRKLTWASKPAFGMHTLCYIFVFMKNVFVTLDIQQVILKGISIRSDFLMCGR